MQFSGTYVIVAFLAQVTDDNLLKFSKRFYYFVACKFVDRKQHAAFFVDEESSRNLKLIDFSFLFKRT